MNQVHIAPESDSLKGKAIIVAKKGNDSIVLRLAEVACFFTKERLVFAINKEGRKFLINKTIAQLEESLDPHIFFRINRQCIVSIYFIKRFRTFQRSRIEIELNLPEPATLLISQSATVAFRRWINAD